MKKIILIGGAPGSGKSTLAKKMSVEMNIPWISTDDIRGMMRKVCTRDVLPHLFDLDEAVTSAEEYLTSHTPRQIVEDQYIESQDVWKGVAALIENSHTWGNFIVEGVAILPSFVFQYSPSNISIKNIFLVDEDTERIKDTVYTRGIWDDAKTYSDGVKGIEVEWVSLFNQQLKKEAVSRNFPVYQITNREEDWRRIIDETAQWL